jgi:hypothetical protein
MNEETEQDFEARFGKGGEAFVGEVRLIDGLSDDEIRPLFDRARDAEYAEIVKNWRALAKLLRSNATAECRVRWSDIGLTISPCAGTKMPQMRAANLALERIRQMQKFAVRAACSLSMLRPRTSSRAREISKAPRRYENDGADRL